MHSHYAGSEFKPAGLAVRKKGMTARSGEVFFLTTPFIEPDLTAALNNISFRRRFNQNKNQRRNYG